MPNWVTSKLTINGPNSAEIMKSLLIKNEENEIEFDFNKIIPMPKDLDIESGSITTDCINIYLSYLNPDNNAIENKNASLSVFKQIMNLVNSSRASYIKCTGFCSKESVAEIMQKYKNDKYKELKDLIKFGRKAVKNIMDYGAIDWYDWCNKNWGTKWNACHNIYLEEHPNEIYFDTAWGNVSELITKLSTMHPDNQFTYEYAEEDTGFQTGNLTFQNGVVIAGCHYPNLSKEAYEQCFKLWGEDISEYYIFNEETQTYDYIDKNENTDEGEMD